LGRKDRKLIQAAKKIACVRSRNTRYF